MPAGVSLSSTGMFNGTPTTAGTFGPYVFTVNDSKNTSASSGSLSIMMASAQLAVTIANLPNGTVGVPYSTALTAIGGTSPYTWKQTSGGAMPPGLVPLTNGGIIAGVPTTVGTYGPYVFTVTDANNATANSISMTITIGALRANACTSLGNETALTSANPYAFLVKGTDGTGKPVEIAGSFTPDGRGGLAQGAADYNGFTNGHEQMQVNVSASSFGFANSAFGCLYLAFSGPSISGVQFSFSLGGFDGTIYHTGRIIESDFASGSGKTAAGLMHVQTTSAFSLSSLEPNYAFGLDGWTTATTGVVRTAIAGAFTNSSGALSAGFADVNAGGTASGQVSGGGGNLNSTIDRTSGRGTGTYTIPLAAGNLTFSFVFYILNGADILLLSMDSAAAVGSPPLLSGRALGSSASYAAGALDGYYLLASQGLAVSGGKAGNLAEIGTVAATNAGTVPTATIYANNAGSYTTNPYPNSGYTVEAASGRVSFTGLTATPPVIYLTAAGTPDDGIGGFLVGTDAEASSGVLVNQSLNAPSFAPANVAGNYAASTAEDVNGLDGTFLGVFTFNGKGGYMVIPQVVGPITNTPGLGTIAVNADGSGSLDGGSFPLVTNGTVIFAIPDSGDPQLFVFTANTPPS
jgi:hypothetical protein